MKKIISGSLCAVMLLGIALPVSAAETNNTVLTYTNEASYEISIPAEASINKETGNGSIIIDITDTNLADNQFIAVSVASSNYADNTWNLLNTEDVTNKLTYKMGTTDGASDIASGNRVVSASEVSSTTLYVELNEEAKVGSYTDTLTFTSEIIKLISFKERGNTFQAEDGMTFIEWFASPYNTDNLDMSNYGIKILYGDYISSDSVIENGVTYYFVERDLG